MTPINLKVTKKNSLEMAQKILNCGKDQIFILQNGEKIKGAYTFELTGRVHGTVYRWYEADEGECLFDCFTLQQVAKGLYYRAHH